MPNDFERVPRRHFLPEFIANGTELGANLPGKRAAFASRALVPCVLGEVWGEC